MNLVLNYILLILLTYLLTYLLCLQHDMQQRYNTAWHSFTKRKKAHAYLLSIGVTKCNQKLWDDNVLLDEKLFSQLSVTSTKVIVNFNLFAKLNTLCVTLYSSYESNFL